MASTFQYLDLDLCRKIMLRTEEVLTSNKPKGPDNYEFEGYSPEMVEFNIRKLHDGDMICARERTEKRRHVINIWPELLYDRGLAFLEVARDESVWMEAIERVEASGRQPTLRKMKRTLLETARETLRT